MKKILIILCMVFSLLPGLCFAGTPVIESDTRTFDVRKGIYDLQGNVFVQFPAHDQTLTIKGDQTQVYLYDMEVHGKGNISLDYGDLSFLCDAVDVYHKQRTAYVTGNCHFQQDDLRITADKGSFNWKTKLVTFEGNVIVDSQQPQEKVVYHVIRKEFMQKEQPTAVPQAA